MMKNRKKGIFAGSLLLLILLFTASCSQGNEAVSGIVNDDEAEYIIRFAHVVTPATSKGMAAERFAELIEERTNGRIKVQIYPESQLGSDREIIEQMQSGAVQMNAPFTGVLPTFVDKFEFFDLPFLFTDREQAYELLNGELLEVLGEDLIGQDLYLLGFWDGGPKHLTNSVHPIESPEDMDGLKMRASQSPLLIQQFQDLNAGGVSIDFSELYTSLQTETVDGQENPLSNIVTRRFYEVQDYLTLSGHGYMAYPLIISKEFYDDLPEDLQIAVNEVAQEVTEWQWAEAEKAEEEYMEILNDSDIQITELSAEQKEEFETAMSGVYEEFSEIEGSEELLEIIE